MLQPWPLESLHAAGGPCTSLSLLILSSLPPFFSFPRSAPLHRVPQVPSQAWENGKLGSIAQQLTHSKPSSLSCHGDTLSRHPQHKSSLSHKAWRHLFSDELLLPGWCPRASLARVWAPEHGLAEKVDPGLNILGIFSACAGCHGPPNSWVFGQEFLTS